MFLIQKVKKKMIETEGARLLWE